MTTTTDCNIADLGSPGITVIVGGCGRVGLPLGIALASRNVSVKLLDVDAERVKSVNSGHMPFREQGAPIFSDKLLVPS